MKQILFLTLTMLLMVAPSAKGMNWMERLPDDTFVSVLSIPGAHDAATGSGWSSMGILGNRYAKTQELTIGELWTAGVRAFDFRPCVYPDFMNINHGIMPTNLHFEDVLCQLRDSLMANPSEFVIIHLLHATEGDQVENVYNNRLLEVLGRDDLKDYFINFRRNLTVGNMRGKILLLSRDKYATKPIGGFFQDWVGYVDWARQSAAKIVGNGTTSNFTATLWVQDFSDTHGDGALDLKVEAINKMLTEITTHKTRYASQVRWVFNFASGYSKVESLLGNEISLADGYRDNAVRTHAAILDFLQTHDAGPTGVILMDFAGVDASNGYAVKGLELVNALIDNNFEYIDPVPTGIHQVLNGKVEKNPEVVYDLQGRRQKTLRHGTINVVRKGDGTIKKVLVN